MRLEARSDRTLIRSAGDSIRYVRLSLDAASREPRATREPVRGLWRRILCGVGLHRRARIATPDPTVWREVCDYCGDERCDVEEVG